jgi:hypothetical protein
MTKLELIQKLEAAKEISPVVSIEAMISLIDQLEETQTVSVLDRALVEKISADIEQCLDYNASDLVDTDNIDLILSYNNQIEVNSASINVCSIMDHINSILDSHTIS